MAKRADQIPLMPLVWPENTKVRRKPGLGEEKWDAKGAR